MPFSREKAFPEQFQFLELFEVLIELNQEFL